MRHSWEEPQTSDVEPEITCTVCGEEWYEDESGIGGYVTISDETVCYDCRIKFIEDQFSDYIVTHNIMEKVDKIMANPELDSVLALERELSEWALDEYGVVLDTYTVSSVLGPIADLADLLRRGLPEFIPEVLKDLKRGVAIISGMTYNG